MRIRTVKPEYFTHPEIVRLSPPARLLLLSLFTQADDEGRLYDQPRRIAGNAFGDRDKVNIDRLLAELEAHGRIQRYEAKGRKCIQIPGFRDHQAINKFRASTVPAPGSGQEDSGNVPGTGQEDSGTTPVGNGREGNQEGKGKEGKDLARTTPRRQDFLWEAVLKACEIDPSEVPKAARSGYNAAVSGLRDLGATPSEIAKRAANAWFKLTPHALLRHWAELATSKNGSRAPGRRTLEQAAELKRRGL